MRLRFSARSIVELGGQYVPRHLTTSVMPRIITPDVQTLIDREKQVLTKVGATLKSVNGTADPEELTLLEESINRLDAPFLIVIAGEFDAGKSSLVNSLLGGDYLKVGVTPTTAEVKLITYEDFPDAEWLKQIQVVDTPGTNSIVEGHQELTEHFIPKSDLVLIATSSDRPLSESESKFMDRIRLWRKKLVVVLTKTDLFASKEDHQKVLDFCRENLPEGTPVISVKRGDHSDLSEYIFKTLGANERLMLKLQNPLSVAQRLLGEHVLEVQARLKELAVDSEKVAKIERQLEAFKNQTTAEFKYQKEGLANILLRMNSRASAFLDDRIRLSKIFSLLNSTDFKRSFEREVIGASALETERHLNDVADWMMGKNQRQLARTLEIVASSSNSTTNTLKAERRQLAEEIRRSAASLLDSFDTSKTASSLASTLRSSVMQVAGIELGVAGVATMFSAALFDFTGILGLSAAAATGVAVLPYKRYSVKKALGERIENLERQMTHDLEEHFERQLRGAVSEMREAVKPYTLYVETEIDRANRSQETLNADLTECATLEKDIIKKLT